MSAYKCSVKPCIPLQLLRHTTAFLKYIHGTRSDKPCSSTTEKLGLKERVVIGSFPLGQDTPHFRYCRYKGCTVVVSVW